MAGMCIFVEDGKSFGPAAGSVSGSRNGEGKPTLVIANTVKGYGSAVMENKASWHHHVPTDEEYEQIMKDFAERKEAALRE